MIQKYNNHYINLNLLIVLEYIKKKYIEYKDLKSFYINS